MHITLKNEQQWDFVELTPHVYAKKHKLFSYEILWRICLILIYHESIKSEV